MSGTMMGIRVGFTVRDGVDCDEAADDLRDELQSMLNAWYEQRGHLLLSIEPVVV